jgi:hypothetical protein
MKSVRITAFAIALACTAAAHAQTNFIANLTPEQETTPPIFTHSGTGQPRPFSFGSAMLVLSADMSTLSFTVTIFNIDITGNQTPTDANDNLVNAHIHAAATTGQPGTNAGVVFGFFGTPFNDNNPNNVVVTPFASGVGGTITSIWNVGEGNNTTLAAQLPNIYAGRSYLNFHTTQNAGGEIRGQILIPEPSTYALLAAGALGLGVQLWRRRKAAANAERLCAAGLRDLPIVMVLARERPVWIRFHELQTRAQTFGILLFVARERLHVAIPEVRPLVWMESAEVFDAEAV